MINLLFWLMCSHYWSTKPQQSVDSYFEIILLYCAHVGCIKFVPGHMWRTGHRLPTLGLNILEDVQLL